MIPTFSVNTQKDKITSDSMLSLASQLEQGKTFTEQGLDVAVDKIVEEGTEIKDISAYSKVVEKFSQLKRAESKFDYFITYDEMHQGYKGVIISEYAADDVDICLVECIVQEFLDIRENLYYVEGIDIFRLLELSLQGDEKAQKKLRVAKDNHVELSQLLFDTLSTPGVIQRLIDILA